MAASLKRKGRLAVVIDTGAVSRGSGNTGRNRERDIRKEFVEKDLVEAVILLPDNLFYNTTAPAVIIVIDKNKRTKSEILLINASKLCNKGRPKNYLPDEAITTIFDIYCDWVEKEGISKIIKNQEAINNDYNLSPSRYVSSNCQEEVMPLEEAVVLLKEANEQRRESEERLFNILRKMGLNI